MYQGYCEPMIEVFIHTGQDDIMQQLTIQREASAADDISVGSRARHRASGHSVRSSGRSRSKTSVCIFVKHNSIKMAIVVKGFSPLLNELFDT